MPRKQPATILTVARPAHKQRSCAAAAVLCLASGSAAAQSARPNPTTAPGATNPEVTQDTIADTICRPGWARSVRPPRKYTSALKRRQLQALGYADQHMRDYEEDHLIPLELGGAPDDERNLWPEPLHSTDGWDARQKDDHKGVLNKRVCRSELSLDFAQREIARSWTNLFFYMVRHGFDYWPARLRGREAIAMCNLYSFTKGQQAIRDAARIMSDLTGNLPLLPGIFPDYEAPIVNGPAGRELVKAR